MKNLNIFSNGFKILLRCLAIVVFTSLFITKVYAFTLAELLIILSGGIGTSPGPNATTELIKEEIDGSKTYREYKISNWELRSTWVEGECFTLNGTLISKTTIGTDINNLSIRNELAAKGYSNLTNEKLEVFHRTDLRGKPELGTSGLLEYKSLVKFDTNSDPKEDLTFSEIRYSYDLLGIYSSSIANPIVRYGTCDSAAP
jgi:hypothetical protein